MKLQAPPGCLKMPAGEVFDHGAVTVTQLYIFGMRVHMLNVHFLIEVGSEQRVIHICCLEAKSLMVERFFNNPASREYLGTYLQARLHYLE